MTLDEALDESGVIAILRGVKPTEVLAVTEALHGAGVRIVEVPLNSPDPFESIRLLSENYVGRMFFGGGTILSVTDVERVAGAGGRLMVAPNTDPGVIRRSVALGMIPFPGFATASEAFAAIEAGARHLKLFPASTYGVGHLKALKAVLSPDVVIAPVGGVGAADMAEWRRAGAGPFGIGSELYKPGMAVEDVARKAAELVKADRAAKPA